MVCQVPTRQGQLLLGSQGLLQRAVGSHTATPGKLPPPQGARLPLLSRKLLGSEWASPSPTLHSSGASPGSREGPEWLARKDT